MLCSFRQAMRKRARVHYQVEEWRPYQCQCLSGHNSHRGDFAAVLVTSCAKMAGRRKENRSEKRNDFLDKDAKPDERKYLAGQNRSSFRRQPEICGRLRAALSHARARMSFTSLLC